MPYRVVKREVPATRDGKVLDFMVSRYYVTLNGMEPRTDGHFPDPFVEVWADGCITANWRGKRLFLYDDQWVGIIKAVRIAMRDKETMAKEAREKWLEETIDDKEFCDIPVDLSRREVIEALTTCEIGLEEDWPQIIYKGQKWGLGRTDLKDNVATGLCVIKSAEEWRAHYLAKAKTCFGGRLQHYSDGRRGFSVIDAFSDG